MQCGTKYQLEQRQQKLQNTSELSSRQLGEDWTEAEITRLAK
jgi:hypothetical protein